MVVLALLGSSSLRAPCSNPGCQSVAALQKAQATSLRYSTPANDLRFTEISRQAGITFKHVFSPEKKYIAESMSGGVALFDYDNDGYLDIYFVNSLTVDLAKSHQKTRSALYHNNGNNSFTDVTDKAGRRRHWIWYGSRRR